MVFMMEPAFGLSFAPTILQELCVCVVEVYIYIYRVMFYYN